MKKDIIRAILDGKIVQFEKAWINPNGKLVHTWTDLNTPDMLDIEIYSNAELYISLFTDAISTKWRIKSDIKLMSYRVALFKDESDYYTNTAESYEEAEELEKSIYFKKWLTDCVTFNAED